MARTAPITTAVGAVVGRFSSGSVTNSRTASIPSAVVTLASRVPADHLDHGRARGARTGRDPPGRPRSEVR